MEKQHNKIVFITGASSGLGEGLAIKFAKSGYKVVMAARRIEKLREMAESLNLKGEKVLPVVCDVTDLVSVCAAVKVCLDKWGHIDILVANAGIGEPSPGHRFDAAIYHNLLQTNVMGAVYSVEAVLPSMMKRGCGQLVGIGSLASYRGLPEAGAYCASKAALGHIFESLRLDLKKYHIKVSTIHPGYIRSPMTDRNRYYMPFLMSAEKGVDCIYRAIINQKKVYAFPWTLAMCVSMLRLLPAGLYDFFAAGRKNKKQPRDPN